MSWTELSDIGGRLRAYRLGSGLSVDEIAEQLHVSRAAVYRFEKFGINQVETLQRVARLLDVSLASLLGVGVEYTNSVTTYLERYRQIEEQADSLFVVFGPISYVLTSDEYDRALRSALEAEMSSGMPERQAAQAVSNIMSILQKRKLAYRRRRPSITNIISSSDLVRFALREFAAGDAAVDPSRLEIARRELDRIGEMFRHPPIGVQLGLVFERLPTTSYSLVRQYDRSTVLISPFRLGPELNVRSGVAMTTSAEEAVRLHQAVGEHLWSMAVSGEQAAEFIRAQF